MKIEMDDIADLADQQLERMREQLGAKLRKRGVFLDDRLISTFVLPYFVPATTEDKWARRAEQLLVHVEDVARAALEDRALFARLKLDPRAEDLVRVDPGYRRVVVIARPDSLISPDGPVFLEMNADGPSMAAYADVLTECLLELPELESLCDRVSPESRTDRLLDALLECYREFGAPIWPPTVAITEWLPSVTPFEDPWTAQRFEARGIPAMVCDPRSFRRSGPQLESNGRPVHLIYRRMPVRELAARRSEIEPLLSAYRDGLVCIVNPLRAHVASSKTFMAALSERGATMVAPTVVVDPERRGTFDRASWVLKRAESSAGDHVLLPDVATAAQWTDALERAGREVWVAQKRCPIPTLDIPRREPMFYNWNPFIYGGRYGGSFVCASESPLINHMKGGMVMPLWPYR